MKSNFVKYLALALVLSMLITVGACAKPTPTPPPSVAEFEVISLDIEPPEVMAGETVSITAEIKNIGDSEGSYTAVLTVDGATVETKEVTLAPGVSKTASFSLVKDIPGTYQVGIGELTSSLIVKEKPVVKDVELKYDDGKARDYISAYPPILTGYLVDFTPPATPFTIKKVRICGQLAPEWTAENFEVEIWDKDYGVLHSAAYPVTKFTQSATWVELEMPDIEVSDKFYVHVHTGTGIMEGIHIGADDSIVNEHSETTIRTAEGTTRILVDWPYRADLWFGDKSKVNWMIRVVGTVVGTEETRSKNIIIDGAVNEWPFDAVTISDPCGDISSNVESEKAVDLKTIYALIDENYLYVAIQICDVFAPSLLRNYFIALDFDKDQQHEYHFGVRPNGDTWVFDLTKDKNNWDAESTSGVVAVGKGNTIEVRIPRNDYGVPSSILIYCRVTEGGPTVDETEWFEVP